MAAKLSSLTKAVIEQFEASSSVIYVLDHSLRIVYCNAAWDRFAERNGGDSCRRERVVGADLPAVIADPLRLFYTDGFRRVLTTQCPWEHEYECSSAESNRFLHMRALPLGKRHLLVENSVVVERPHDPQRLRMPPIETMYTDASGSILMCAHCRRTRRITQTAPVWDWVPDFVNNLPRRTSQGLCENCRAYYFGSE